MLESPPAAVSSFPFADGDASFVELLLASTLLGGWLRSLAALCRCQDRSLDRCLAFEMGAASSGSTARAGANNALYRI